jgi:cell division protein FtsN
MAARISPLALASVAAVVAFVAGALAPDTLRDRLKEAEASAAAVVKTAAGAKPAASAASGAASSAAAPASAASSPASAVAMTPTPSVPMGSILLPTLTPTTATYALQAAQFASPQAANQMAAGLNGQGVSSTVTLVIDSTNTAWAVVSVGRFGSADEAVANRSRLANKLGLSQYLSPMALPAPKPASSP